MRNCKCNRAILGFIAIVFQLTISTSSAEDVSLSINVKKTASVISEKFLSLTVDPASLFTGDTLRYEIKQKQWNWDLSFLSFFDDEEDELKSPKTMLDSNPREFLNTASIMLCVKLFREILFQWKIRDFA